MAENNQLNGVIEDVRANSRDKVASGASGNAEIFKAGDTFRTSTEKLSGEAEKISDSIKDSFEAVEKGLKGTQANQDALNKAQMNRERISQMKESKSKSEMEIANNALIEGLKKNTSAGAKAREFIGTKLMSFDTLAASVGAYMNSPAAAIAIKFLGDRKKAMFDAKTEIDAAATKAGLETAEKLNNESVMVEEKPDSLPIMSEVIADTPTPSEVLAPNREVQEISGNTEVAATELMEANERVSAPTVQASEVFTSNEQKENEQAPDSEISSQLKDIVGNTEVSAIELMSMNERAAVKEIQSDEIAAESQIMNERMLAALQDIDTSTPTDKKEEDTGIAGMFKKGKIGKTLASLPGLIGGSILTFAKAIPTLLGKGLGKIAPGLMKGIGSSLAKGIFKFFVAIPLLIANMVKGIFKGIARDPEADIGTKIINMMKGVVAQMLSFFSFGLIDADSAMDTMDNLGGIVTASITNAIDTVISWWDNNSFGDMIKGLLALPMDLLGQAIDWIGDELFNKEDVAALIGTVKTSMTDWIDSLIQSMKDMFTGMIDAFKQTGVGKVLVSTGVLDPISTDPESQKIQAAEAENDARIQRGKEGSASLIEKGGLKDTGMLTNDFTVDDQKQFSEILKSKTAKELKDILAFNEDQTDSSLSDQVVSRIQDQLTLKSAALTGAAERANKPVDQAVNNVSTAVVDSSTTAVTNITSNTGGGGMRDASRALDGF